MNLTNIATSDAGNYTCVMTNECGVTITMPLTITVNCLGTNTTANFEKTIKLYPNPTSSVLNIELPKNIEVTIISLKVANSLGQVVVEQKGDNSNSIDVSVLQSGIYFVSVSTNYGNWNGKFVKE